MNKETTSVNYLAIGSDGLKLRNDKFNLDYVIIGVWFFPHSLPPFSDDAGDPLRRIRFMYEGQENTLGK